MTEDNHDVPDEYRQTYYKVTAFIEGAANPSPPTERMPLDSISATGATIEEAVDETRIAYHMTDEKLDELLENGETHIGYWVGPFRQTGKKEYRWAYITVSHITERDLRFGEDPEDDS